MRMSRWQKLLGMFWDEEDEEDKDHREHEGAIAGEDQTRRPVPQPKVPPPLTNR